MSSFFPSLPAPPSGVFLFQVFFNNPVFRCLLQLVYHGKCTLTRPEVEELHILASSLGLSLSRHSFDMEPICNMEGLSLVVDLLKPVPPEAILEESDVMERRKQDPNDPQVCLGLEEITKEPVGIRMLTEKDQEPAVDQSKIKDHKKLLRSLFEGRGGRAGYKCLLCGKNLIAWASVVTHCERHLDIRVPCTQCPKIFKASFGMYWHMRNSHGVKGFKQSSCEVQSNPAAVAKAKAILKSHSHQNSVVGPGLELEAGLQSSNVKLETEEGALCENEKRVSRLEGGTLIQKYYDVGKVDMVDLTDTGGNGVAGVRNGLLGNQVKKNGNAALAESSQLEEDHQASMLPSASGIKQVLDREEEVCHEKDAVSTGIIKSDAASKIEKDFSMGLEKTAELKSKIKPKVSDLNTFLTCNICKGYLVNATTITNCLHTCMFSHKIVN